MRDGREGRCEEGAEGPGEEADREVRRGLPPAGLPSGEKDSDKHDVKSDTLRLSLLRVAGAESLAHNATNHGSSEFIAW